MSVGVLLPSKAREKHGQYPRGNHHAESNLVLKMVFFGMQA